MIGLMGVDIFDRDEEIWKNKYISEYTFREKETHDLLDETIIIIFAEIARFDKKGDECRTDLDRMCYVLKNSAKLYTESLRNQPEWLKQEVFVEILKACEIAGFSKKKRIQYDKDMYDERRFYSELYTARREGMNEGMEKGIEKGRAEGKRECRRSKDKPGEILSRCPLADWAAVSGRQGTADSPPGCPGCWSSDRLHP
jgi:hypothetical protein